MSSANAWLNCEVPAEVAVLPLGSAVLFPLQVASVQVARKPNLALIAAHGGPDEIVAAGVQLDPDGPPSKHNLSHIAVASRILSRLKMPDGTVQIVIQGLRRIQIAEVVSTRPFMRARVACLDDLNPHEGVNGAGDETAVGKSVGKTVPAARTSPEVRALLREVTRKIRELVEIDPRYPDELLKVLRLNRTNTSHFADLITDMVRFEYDDKRRVLEAVDTEERLTIVLQLLEKELGRARLAVEVKTKTDVTIQRAERESYLREQLRVIRSELGQLDPLETEIEELERTVGAATLPPHVAETALREVGRLRSAENRTLAAVEVRTHLEWLMGMPWAAPPEERLNLRTVRQTLDERHVGLTAAKERILEWLSVRKLGGRTRGSMLCFVGPPGTGKTTLGESVALALGRPFSLCPMAGLRDVDELRGHRPDDVGARPGLIARGLRAGGAAHPVFVFEDIDTYSLDDGDVTSALLEVLDPRRNGSFIDRYIAVPFDLSQALFVATATLDEEIPDPLFDLMDVIELSGYTETEKVQIARRHVWPRVVEQHGLKGRDPRMTKAAFGRVIRDYTREAGVYELTQQLGRICRRLATRVASNPRITRNRLGVDTRNLVDYLGEPIYVDDKSLRASRVGVATGLAWTENGGDLLPIEAIKMPGEGETTLTGLLGDVMRESARAAMSYVRSQAAELGIAEETFKKCDLHIHFPEGAVPKDGPSAGIALAVVVASLLTERPVRADIALTGELSLRGSVLPVGRVKEKVLAAHRAGMRHVVLAAGNAADVVDIPKEVRSKVKLHFVSHVDEVFAFALRARKRR